MIVRVIDELHLQGYVGEKMAAERLLVDVSSKKGTGDREQGTEFPITIRYPGVRDRHLV
jgi:hypothetical protein